MSLFYSSGTAACMAFHYGPRCARVVDQYDPHESFLAAAPTIARSSPIGL